MNEDLKPIYDFEADWTRCDSGNSSIIVFENKKLESLYRVINVNEQSITFSDVERVSRIKDIDKVLTKTDDEKKNKERFQPLVNMIIDELKPISMPYAPEKLTCFIENFPGFDGGFDDTLGILYFREEKEDGNMIEAKRFFKVNPDGVFPKYDEISREVYDDVKIKWYKKCEKEDE